MPIERTVDIVAGQKVDLSDLDWQPKAVLVLRWSEGERQGAIVKLRKNNANAVPQLLANLPDRQEFALEPGNYELRIERAEGKPYVSTFSLFSGRIERKLSFCPPATTVAGW